MKLGSLNGMILLRIVRKVSYRGNLRRMLYLWKADIWKGTSNRKPTLPNRKVKLKICLLQQQVLENST